MYFIKKWWGPKIISPSESFEYLIDKDDPQEIVLLSAADPKIKNHYWYVNDELISKCQPGEKVFINYLWVSLKLFALTI